LKLDFAIGKTMRLPELFKAEGLDPSLAAAVCFSECKYVRGKKTQPREIMQEAEWTKGNDGCWHSGQWRFTPAIAKLGDLENAFDHPATQS
jgi:hypothetical protein